MNTGRYIAHSTLNIFGQIAKLFWGVLPTIPDPSKHLKQTECNQFKNTAVHTAVQTNGVSTHQKKIQLMSLLEV